jgi:hypothetical protein
VVGKDINLCVILFQYIATAKQQVAFTNEVKQMLKQAAQDIVDHNQSVQQQN